MALYEKNNSVFSILVVIRDQGAISQFYNIFFISIPTSILILTCVDINFSFVYIPQCHSTDVFPAKCNKDSVSLEEMTEDGDLQFLQSILQEFKERTGSAVAEDVLNRWPASAKQFVKVRNSGGFGGKTFGDIDINCNITTSYLLFSMLAEHT